MDFDSWHLTKLISLYNGKGSMYDPNNYHRICLKETTAKIVSIIAACKLLSIFKNHGSITQFGHVGCKNLFTYSDPHLN